MHRQIRVCYKSLAILLILGLVDIILDNITVLPSWGSGKISESPVISLRGENLSLKNICKEISIQTGYQILFDFDEQSENARITVKWDNQFLNQSVREILKKIGIQNFVIVTDDENRTLNVFNFDRRPLPRTAPTISDGTGLTLQELMAVHERQKKEMKMNKKDPDEILIQPEDGHPGVTRRELQNLHDRQKKEIEISANDPDAVAMPASDAHPALTNRQLQDLHERQKK